MIDNTYPIHERMFTFQGEGVHMGLPAFFIRTFGCPVHCTFCDAAGTWHPKWIPKHIPRMAPEELVAEAKQTGVDLVVITGGEPAIHDLSPLCNALHEEGFKVHLETSGAFPIRGRLDWITLSPKRAKEPLAENIARTDEFKFIIEAPEDILFYTTLIKELGYLPVRKISGHDDIEVPIWLHPEWSQRQNRSVIGLICNTVRNGAGGFRAGIFRAGWQLHKLYQVDANDPRSQPLVPLGGDINKGI